MSELVRYWVNSGKHLLASISGLALSGSSSRTRFKMPLSRGFDSSTGTAGPRTYAGIPSMRLNPVAPGSNKVRFNLKLAAAKSA